MTYIIEKAKKSFSQYPNGIFNNEIDSSVSVAVVIPCYKVTKHILSVLEKIGPEVDAIYTVDDKCPEESYKYIQENVSDPRVKLIRRLKNGGVGGATITGYKEALKDNHTIIIKVDGDGQMNPNEIPRLIAPLLSREADYVKANRFFSLEHLKGMPFLRVFGNSMLSFISKASSGYWNIMDPTNGYTAIHATSLRLLPFDKLEQRFFFESDMLFRLNTIRAVVKEIPIASHYGDEVSNLRIRQVLLTFPQKFINRFLKRIFYNYFLRDFGICSLQLIFGLFFLAFGILFGSYAWIVSVSSGVTASSGTIMLAALPLILGFQLLLSSMLLDISNVPKEPLCNSILYIPLLSRSSHYENSNSTVHLQQALNKEEYTMHIPENLSSKIEISKTDAAE
jgi:dolichol-phosphate mannosyltransferase